LNVNNVPEKEVPTAVSLNALLGRRVARKEILVEFLDRFERRVSEFDPEEVIKEWRAVNSTIGRPVNIVTMKNTFTGTAVDIDSQGGLVLQQENGSRQTVIHGDCFHK
jgi:BirA family biotin operon repressor/biotin-[acetyl-CoA-carboxylase] ligase